MNSLFERRGSRSPSAQALPRQSWQAGPVSPVLWPNEVHVWRARLDAPRSKDFELSLSDDDRERAARFRFEGDRHRFIMARASLRAVLARYLKTSAARLQFDLGPFGKPALAPRQNTLDLRFNLSHSHQLALIAITRGRELGVDVEFMRADFASDEVAEHFFSPAEVKQLVRLPAEIKTRSFFNCWTRKEAYIKARGEGLSHPLDQFDVSFTLDAPAALLDSRIDPAEVSRWSFEDLSPHPAYAAALTVEGNFSRLLLWDFQGSTIY
ncbi:MAG: 4'-phosphopantetheinyl transferase family protein [Acidobacteriota bacterium]